MLHFQRVVLIFSVIISFAEAVFSAEASAGSLGVISSGRISILGQKVTWVQKFDQFEIKGIKDSHYFKIRFRNGKERFFSPPPVKKLNGEFWSPLALINQIGIDTQSPLQEVEKFAVNDENKIVLSSDHF